MSINQESLNQAAQSLFDMWVSGDFPAQLGWAIIQRSKNDDRPCLHWSISNFMLMLFSGTSDARTYRQWLNTGRVVKRGSHAVKLISPIVVKVNEPKDGEKEELRLVGFKAFNVFPYECTKELEGDFAAVNKIDYTPEVIPELSGKIIKALKGWGVTVEFRPVEDHPGALGYFRESFNNGKGLIVLAETSPSTIAHETVHYLHSLEEDLNTISRERAELVAELGAAVLLSYEGISGYEEQSWHYLKAYVQDAKSDNEVIAKISSVLNLVEKCINRLLSAIEQQDAQ